MVRPIRSLLRSLAPVAVLTAVLVCALPAAASAVEPIFQFTGRGNGHGIGMSQWGAKGFADHGWTYPSILSNYYRHTKLLTVPSKTVTVYLQVTNTPTASWSARSVSGDLMITYVQSGVAITKTLPGTGGKAYTFKSTGDGYTYMFFGTTQIARYPGALTVKEVPAAGQRAMMIVTSASGSMSWANVAYRGALQFVPNGTAATIRLYNLVGLEDYVVGVVPRESYASWPAEQLKAQAVAARSYVMAGTPIVYCTTSSQVYNGYGRWNGTVVVRHTNGSDAPVDAPCAATAGQVLVDADDTATSYKVVKTFFFDTSGGYTEAINNVWTGSAPDPHFVACSDPYEEGTASTYHRWYERKDSAGNVIFNGSPAYGASVLRGKLIAAGVPVPATITDVQITKRGPSGRVMGILIKGAAGDDKTLSGSTAIANFRHAFGWGDTWFYVSRFSWDSTTAKIGSGGSVTVGFHVSGAPASVMNGQVKGLIKDGVNTGKVLTVTNGYGTVTLTAAGRYWIDSSVYNSAGRPDPSTGDLRGTQWYARNLNYPLTVSVAAAPPAAPAAWSLTAVGLSNRVDLRWSKPAGATSFRVSVSATGFAGSADATGFRTVYNGTATAASDTGAANGTTFYYTAFYRNGAGPWSTAATASVKPAPLVTPTKLTISASPTSVKLPAPFVLSGLLTPGVNGDGVVAEVQKPGSARWSYSSLRLTYNTKSWWYRYTPKLRGTYRFRARFDGGGGRMASTSSIISVTVR